MTSISEINSDYSFCDILEYCLVIFVLESDYLNLAF